ncbi:MAG: DUF4124 domain-containing protein [Gammaproteobacteria bacterium]|nr:DUF4124 domain-containing protein [Gammaproteobacteria bacterium]
MQARTLCAILFVVAGIVLASSAKSSEVLKWVDANGGTHFGDRNAAPDSGAAVIKLRRANGMDAPDTAVLDQGANTAQFVTLNRPQVQNKRGWRGYEENMARNKSRGVRRNAKYQTCR